MFFIGGTAVHSTESGGAAAPSPHARGSVDPAPRRRDPQGRRLAIVNAAAEIIVEQGASSLTHRAVAARAGVALGSTTRYFESIDELREAALQSLADEIDSSLDQIERELSSSDDIPERCAALTHEFLLDARQVHANIALITAAASDPSLRALALRWTDRLTDILARHTGRERAVAIESYLDGAMVHAALHSTPISQEAIARVLHAILAMPAEEEA